MSLLPDPSLVVFTGGERDALCRAAEELALPTERFDASELARKELLDAVDARLQALRLAAVVDAEDDQGLRDELRGCGRRHCLPRVAVTLAGEEGRRRLRGEGFRKVIAADGLDGLLAAPPEREPLSCDRRGDMGPFDLIGDVHGCFDELVELLGALGYSVSGDVPAGFDVTPPKGRRAIFLGDLVDRGPKTPECIALALDMLEAGSAFVLPGNHEEKLVRALRGRAAKLSHGLERSLEQLEERPDVSKRLLAVFESLPEHLVLDGGRLVVAHAGLEERYHGRESGRVRAMALYGPSTGDRDEDGYPVRLDWGADYRGAAHVVYGHTPVTESRWVNRTMNVDNGCVFGGALTALRWPERKLVSVPARKTWWDSKRFPPEQEV